MFTVHRKKEKYKFCLMLVASFTFLLFGCANFSQLDNDEKNKESFDTASEEIFQGIPIDFIEERCSEIPKNMETELESVLLENRLDEFVSKYNAEYKVLSEKEIEQQIENDDSGLLISYCERNTNENDMWFMFEGYPFIIIRHPLESGEYVYYEFLPEGYLEDFAYVMRALGKCEEYFFIEREGIVYLITTTKQEGERIGIATYCMHGKYLYGWALYQERISEDEIGTRYFSYLPLGDKHSTMKWPELEILKEEKQELTSNPIDKFMYSEWVVIEYLGCQVAEFGTVISDEDKKGFERHKKEVEERYLGNTLQINQLYYTDFSEGKIYKSWNELFQRYRQPLVIGEVIEPPFQVIRLKVEDTGVIHSFILGENEKEAVLLVNGHFFKVEKAYKNTFESLRINFIEDSRSFEMPETLEKELEKVLLQNSLDEFTTVYNAKHKELTKIEIQQCIADDSSGKLQDYAERIAKEDDRWFRFDEYPFIIIRHVLESGEYAYYEFLPEEYRADFAYVMRALGKSEEYFFIEWEGNMYFITTKKQDNERIGIATYCMHGENIYGWVLYQEKISEDEIGTRYFNYTTMGAKYFGMEWPELEINE